jgi:multidrug resistance protein
MVAPGLPAIAHQFNMTNTVEIQIVLSIFVLGFAVGPLVLGPLSELYGRVLVLQISNILFLAFNIGCGFATSSGQLLAFRFLAGIGGSAPLAVGGGVLGDLFHPDQRGKAMGLYAMGPLLGPAIGPVAGAWIAQKATWRWMFWATSIADGFILLLGIFYLKESYAPYLLYLKAKRLRKETGNAALRTKYRDIEEGSATRKIAVNTLRSFQMLFTQPIVIVLALYNAYAFGLMYLVLSTFSVLFEQTYHESTGIAGLNYISIGLGLFIGAPICGKGMDIIYKKLKERNPTHEGKPEYRMPILLPFSILVIVGIFIYGWTAEHAVHWIGPNIGAAIFAMGTLASFQSATTYLVDAYTIHAASALAAVSVLRSLAGFGFPLFAPAMYGALGYGWGNSVLGFVGVVIGIPSPFLLYMYGERLRKMSSLARSE